MDRTMPPFNMEPDPAFEIGVEDFRIPVLELPREFIPAPVRDRKIRIYALAGYHTPTGNIKYIPASYMLKRAIDTGLCQRGQTVVEATSGNFGDSLAFCAKRYGLTAAAVVSDNLPEGKLLALRRQGTQILKEGELARSFNLAHQVPTIELAGLYAERIGGVHLNQYGNPWNPESYATLIAPELWRRTGGRASILVSAIGTTGTMMGLGGYFKKQNPRLRVIATMPYLDQNIDGTRDSRRLKEVGFLWQELADHKRRLDARVAQAVSIELHRAGIHAGPSSGAALATLSHYLLELAETDRLDDLCDQEGSIVAITTFADTLFPYDYT
jgi:S-sulfo-L-cysteine synthase (O-acetyl-L-serine-dependent)